MFESTLQSSNGFEGEFRPQNVHSDKLSPGNQCLKRKISGRTNAVPIRECSSYCTSLMLYLETLGLHH
jgi:hypothetical protein